MTRGDGCTEKGRERLWVLVNRRASGSCQPLWMKGPDTHAWRALTLTPVGAKTSGTQGPPECCNQQALPFRSWLLEAQNYNSCQVAKAQSSEPPTYLPQSRKFLASKGWGNSLATFKVLSCKLLGLLVQPICLRHSRIQDRPDQEVFLPIHIFYPGRVKKKKITASWLATLHIPDPCTELPKISFYPGSCSFSPLDGAWTAGYLSFGTRSLCKNDTSIHWHFDGNYKKHKISKNKIKSLMYWKNQRTRRNSYSMALAQGDLCPLMFISDLEQPKRQMAVVTKFWILFQTK